MGKYLLGTDNGGTVSKAGLFTLDGKEVAVASRQTELLMPKPNYVERDMSLFKPTLRLRIDTTPDQIRYILIKAREMMYAHPMVDQGPARIRFLNFDESSLNLEVFAYIKTTDFNEYFEVCEDLNLRFMDIIEEAGTGLAIPARMNYVDDQGRPKNELSRTEAEDKVKEWKEKGEYYIPKFTEQRKEELKETLEYPQKGSPFSKD